MLIEKNSLTMESIRESELQLSNKYEEEFAAASKNMPSDPELWLASNWQGKAIGSYFSSRPFNQTGAHKDVLFKIADSLCRVPYEYKLHPDIVKLLKQRRKMVETGDGITFAFAEALAFGCLLTPYRPEQKPGLRGLEVRSRSLSNFTLDSLDVAMQDHPTVMVRLSGQDVVRGTFSQRHAAVYCQETGREYWQLNNLKGFTEQASISVCNSSLSEYAVLGFEYGFSLSNEMSLVLWEAQFGDFANGAQVVIDQFIASGEVKWGRANGLVMMLPHGYEGQGPEHSSARLERFMQLCADTNMQVIQPTTASQIFHVLRRQMIRQFRKPLILMTPKSLLRNKEAASPLTDFTKGGFHTILPERDEAIEGKKVTRLVMCSGKVYYDLAKTRTDKKLDDVAIIRLEQLYPFPHKALNAELKKYPNLEEVVWCQDEPQNQGAWFFVQHNILENMSEGMRLAYAGRPASASPACGYAHLHQEQQKSLLTAAFAKLKGYVITK